MNASLIVCQYSQFRSRSAKDPLRELPPNVGLKAKCVARSLLAVVYALLLSACAAYQPGLGFEELRENVSKRSGSDLHWSDAQGSSAEIRTTVDRLLQAPLTADSVVRVVLLNSPTGQAILETLNVAQADMILAGLVANPFVAGDARFGGDKTAFDFSIGQSLLDLVYLPQRWRIGRAEFDAAKAKSASAMLDLVWQARNAFLEFQAAKDTYELRKNVLAAIEASYTLARKLYAAGNITDLALTNEEALFEEEKLALISAELAVTEKSERLGTVMGLASDPAATWQIAAHLPKMPSAEPTREVLEKDALAGNLELDQLRNELKALGERSRLAAPLAVFPAAEAGAASQRDTDGSWASGPSLSISLPLFNQGQAARGKADAEVRRAQAKYRAAEISLITELRLAKVRLMKAREEVQRQNQVILPLRKRIVKETEQQYVAMLVGGFELLKAKRDEIDARAVQITALLGYWRARADLERLLAGGKVQSTTEEK